MKNINSIKEIINNYDNFIIDQWGVMHDGVNGFKHAIDAIEYLKRSYKAYYESDLKYGVTGFTVYNKMYLPTGFSGPEKEYIVPLPNINEPKKAILETYTKEYSAEYQSQALIDLAKKLKKRINNLNQIKKIDIYTSHHTHYVIGTGANDPQKMDPNASRETLDHSIMYIFAVALEDGSWHHVKSYTKARAKRKSTIKIWKSIKTHEDKKWTKRYHDPNPRKKAFGAKVVITLKNGKKVVEEQGVADAHPYGSRPFKRKNYINKFLTLTENILDKKEIERFLKTVQNLRKLKSGQLDRLNIIVKKSKIKRNLKKGIF